MLRMDNSQYKTVTQ